MKKIIIITVAAITTLTMLFSFLPISIVLAKKDDTNVTLKVKNQTGGKVAVMLIDENGNHIFFEYGPGQTNTVVFEGHFRYYASTPCGNQSGIFNLNVTKELLFSCGNGLEVTLIVPVGRETCMPGMPNMPDMPEHESAHCHHMTHPE